MRIKNLNLEQENKNLKFNLEKVNEFNEKYENKITNLGEDLNKIQNKYNDLSNQYMILSNNYNKLLSEKSNENVKEIIQSQENEIILKGDNFTLNQEKLNYQIEDKTKIKEQDNILLKTRETENISIDKETKESNNIIAKEFIEKNVEIKRYEYYNTNKN